MSLLCNNLNGTGGSWYAANALNGAPNLRAAHTICMRIRFTSTTTTSDRFALNFGETGNTGGTMFNRFNGAGATQFNAARHSSYTAGTSDQAVINAYNNTTDWVHLAVTYDTTNIRSYLNGVLQNTTASLTTRTQSASGTACTMVIAGAFQGVVADVCAFSRVLTATEIKLLSIQRYAPVLSDGTCFGFWPCNFADPGADYSGRGNDAVAEVNTGSAPTADHEQAPSVIYAPRLVRPTFYEPDSSGSTAIGGTVRGGTSVVGPLGSGGDVRSGSAQAAFAAIGGDVRSGSAVVNTLGSGGTVRGGLAVVSTAIAAEGGTIRGGLAIPTLIALGGDARGGSSTVSLTGAGGVVRGGFGTPTTGGGGGGLRVANPGNRRATVLYGTRRRMRG